MDKSKWVAAILWSFSSIVYAGSDQNSSKTPETTQSKDTPSNRQESSDPIDRVIQIMAEAASHSPDYGKDLGDR